MLSFGLIGALENYIPSIVTKFVKTNYKNDGTRFDKGKMRENPERMDYDVPVVLQKIYGALIFLDRKMFSSKSRGINVLMICRK